MPPRVNPIDRVLRRVEKTDTCWLWQGWIQESGYGMLWLKTSKPRVSVACHRVVYEALVGQIPEGMQLDHLCRVRNCVNPAHLEVVTPAENTRRGSTNYIVWLRGVVAGLAQRELGDNCDDLILEARTRSSNSLSADAVAEGGLTEPEEARRAVPGLQEGQGGKSQARPASGALSPSSATEARPQAGAPTNPPGGLRALTEAAGPGERIAAAVAQERKRLVMGTPERYPTTTVPVRVLDAEALLDERDALRETLSVLRDNDAMADLLATERERADRAGAERDAAEARYADLAETAAELRSRRRDAEAERDALRAALRDASQRLLDCKIAAASSTIDEPLNVLPNKIAALVSVARKHIAAALGEAGGDRQEPGSGCGGLGTAAGSAGGAEC